MQQQVVYTVWGLGFGDDENQWELCGTHATQELAQAQREQILQDTGLMPEDVEVREEQVQG